MAGKKTQEGPTGKAVRDNIKRLREDQNLTFAELSRRLDDLDSPIPPLGLRRIEQGERKIDVDDLTALATVLKSSPAYLLLPHVDEASDPAEMTGIKGEAQYLWEWIRGDWSLEEGGVISLDRMLRSKPRWSLKAGDSKRFLLGLGGDAGDDPR